MTGLNCPFQAVINPSKQSSVLKTEFRHIFAVLSSDKICLICPAVVHIGWLVMLFTEHR